MQRKIGARSWKRWKTSHFRREIIGARSSHANTSRSQKFEKGKIRSQKLLKDKKRSQKFQKGSKIGARSSHVSKKLTSIRG